ncbi:MAG: hypothetical protein ACRDSL_25900 [Pseudonocardiaceae bacterium]
MLALDHRAVALLIPIDLATRVQLVTGTLPSPPTVTPCGPVRWVQPSQPDVLARPRNASPGESLHHPAMITRL